MAENLNHPMIRASFMDAIEVLATELTQVMQVADARECSDEEFSDFDVATVHAQVTRHLTVLSAGLLEQMHGSGIHDVVNLLKFCDGTTHMRVAHVLEVANIDACGCDSCEATMSEMKDGVIEGLHQIIDNLTDAPAVGSGIDDLPHVSEE